MNCPFEEEVSALFDGELAADDAARVEAHVAECASCRALLDDLRAIRRTLEPLQPVARRSWLRRRIRVSLPVAAAIAILLMLAPFVVLRRGSPAPASSTFARYDGGGRAVIRVVKR